MTGRDEPPNLATVHPEAIEAVRAAIADIDIAHNVAVAAVEAMLDPVAAMAAVGVLTTHMQKLTDADAELRTQIAGRIRDANKTSLAGLADRFGTSSRKAQQRANEGEGPPSSP